MYSESIEKELLKFWDNEKNHAEMDKNHISTKVKYWWKCNKGHSFSRRLDHQRKGLNCIICEDYQVLSGYNDVSTVFPELMKLWDFKNNNLNPKEILKTYAKKVWWKCDKGHSYERKIKEQKVDNKCVYCSDKKILKGFNDIFTKNSKIKDFWDFDKNKIDPYSLKIGSHNKVWLKCENNHSVLRDLHIFAQRTVCLICESENNKINKIQKPRIMKNSKFVYQEHPEVKKYWNFEKNHLVFEEITCSSPIVAEWICKNNHQYQMKIVNKLRSIESCPYCSNQKILIGFNDLATTNPDLAKEIDIEKSLYSATEVSAGSNKKLWWKCKNELHSYEASVVNRKNNNCSYCSGQKTLSGFNDLTTTHPELVKEWNYNKNKITPEEVSKGSYENIWWICNLGHSYQTKINYRTGSGSGCSYCANKKVLTGFNDLATTHPSLLDFWDYNKNTINPKTIAPSTKTKVWWRGKQCGHSFMAYISVKTMRRNLNKFSCDVCSGKIIIKGINDLSTTHYELLKEWDYSKNTITPENVSKGTHTKVWWICEKGHSVESRINDKTSGDGCSVCSGQKFVKGINDLKTLYPELAKEFDSEKSKVSPENIYPSRPNYAWWLCPLNHSYRTKIGHRINGSNCPICSGRKLLQGFNDLQTKNPKIAEEFDKELNKMQSCEVINGSNKHYWWKCNKGHKWLAQCSSRVNGGFGCKICSNTSVSKLEIALFEHIQQIFSQDIEIITNSRQIIKPYELDIYIPELRKAVEFNGDYWHSDTIIRRTKGISAKDYHQQKMKLCNDNNIDLVFVWESDWLNNSEIVKKDLRNFLLNDFVNDSLIQLEKSFRIFEEI